jgi:hypothetical protein
MPDNLAEMLYMAYRSSRLPFNPDIVSWGNVRDPDVRAAWEAAAEKARKEMARRFVACIAHCKTEYLPPNDPLEGLRRIWEARS